MSASFVCIDCQPEGAPMHQLFFPGMVFGPPVHCHGKNDRTIKGVMGGVVCPCECNRRESGDE